MDSVPHDRHSVFFSPKRRPRKRHQRHDPGGVVALRGGTGMVPQRPQRRRQRRGLPRGQSRPLPQRRRRPDPLFPKMFQHKTGGKTEREKAQYECPIAPPEFVEKALRSRLEMIIPYLSRWPQAIAIMALPPNVPNALATLLTDVDDICHYAGDRSVDFNWYARRLGVAGVYKATELYLIQDTSPEYNATWMFLNKRLKEAVQIHEIVCKADLGSQSPKDTVTSAFVTARNILGVNWSR